MRPASAARPGSRALRLAASVLAFQGAWFACILTAAHGTPWPGLLAVLAAVCLMLALGNARRADIALVVVAVLTGVVVDTLLVQLGLVRYASPGPLPALAPAWILALWALWGAILREPLGWLHGRPLAAAALGGIGGPLSYAAGARMGACTFPEPAMAMAALALCWAVVTPLHLALAARLNRRRVAGSGAADRQPDGAGIPPAASRSTS